MIIDRNEPQRTYSVVETNGSLSIISTFAAAGDTILIQSVSIGMCSAFMTTYIRSRLAGCTIPVCIKDGKIAARGQS